MVSKFFDSRYFVDESNLKLFITAPCHLFIKGSAFNPLPQRTEMAKQNPMNTEVNDDEGALCVSV